MVWWKNFFIDLEANCGLNPTIPAHIWLLHHLFLSSINEDAQQWADAWNSHTLSIRRECNRSPRDIFLFSLYQDGPRGISVSSENNSDDDVEDPSTYGIDWQVAEDPTLMNHLLTNNPQDWQDDNPFTSSPTTLSDVPCEPPNCPLTPQQVQMLNLRLPKL